VFCRQHSNPPVCQLVEFHLKLNGMYFYILCSHTYLKEAQLPATTKTSKKTSKQRYFKYHNDGTVWAKGYTLNGKPEGYFEWFRKNGTIMRSGYFINGKQTGKWTTYDQQGKVYKVTTMK
jgi:antitoxin component YwqK of YwqJK toxin-antitoxin module